MYYHNNSIKEKVEKVNEIAEASRPTGVSQKWLQHVENKADFVKLLRGNITILDTLKTILIKEWESELRQPKLKYTNVNWALERADKDGYLRAIENFINLLTIQNKED